ncbi:MAG: SDR family oxidoreductase [Alphaproteobacteria bacterium]|nr:SDR family oxidoreductase [Alphaproteobacteria bacterium]
MARKQALVAGAQGIVGSHIIAELLRRGDWEVIGLSRRAPPHVQGWRHIVVDLDNAADCAAKLGALAGVTHIFFAARAECQDKFAEASLGLRMIANLMDAVEPAARGLRHVHLMHGTKWYGNVYGPYRTPSREDDPRTPMPIFYYDQQDHIAARQQGKGWSWSAMRPGLICGWQVGSQHNLATLIAVYATLCRELALPMRFPGSEACYRALYQAVDAGLLARASVWCAEHDAAANQAFNINNGDYFRWQSMWPRIAAWFGLDPAEPQRIVLANVMPQRKPAWQEIVRRHGLAPHPYEEIAHWPFGDFIFALGWDDISSTVKLRQAGFTEVVDSEAMFQALFARFRRERLIP